MRSGVVEGFNANGITLRTLTVELLTGETILISTEGKTTCSAIWNRVQAELGARGVIHPQIFGLAIRTGCDWVFVDPDAKVSKYFPKDWKTTPGSSINESKTLVLSCRVHFYLESVPINFDVVSLLHYYLQLRENLASTIPRNSTNLIQPLAYAYQSELGDWTPCQESPSWARPLVSGGAFQKSLTRAHQGLTGLGQNGARAAFIRSLIPAYNMHLYGMNLQTKDGKDTQAWIGVTPKGIEVYQNEMGRNEIPEQTKITFLWANITKLYFKRKKFEIRGRACSCNGSTTVEKLSFTSWSESVPLHLLLLCRSTHQFHLSNNKILLPSTTSGNNGGGDYKTSSSSTSTGTMSSCTSTNGGGDPTLFGCKSDDKMLDLSLWAEGLLLPSGNESNEHQRISVISNASSNTTSGIVSDRVYSLDGSEEDLELRISDSCTERTNHSHNGTNNSTSLESLSHKNHHSRSHNQHPLKSHHCIGIQKNNHHIVESSSLYPSQRDEEIEDKHWYCDSDCEDCECDTGPCRSLLVRTINDGGEKHSCAGFCECNSCVATEDDFERESSSGDSSSNQILINHHNTPSLASEKTLKALDVSAENQENEIINKMEEKSIEKVDEASEHIYGEISEDPKVQLKKGMDYSRIENEIIPPLKPKPKCIKKESSIGIRNNRNEKNHSHCSGHKKLKGVSTNSTVTSAKETSGVIPKVASLKSLRTQRVVSPWSRFKSKQDQRNQSITSLDEADGCYIDFDKKLQQGRYPSTRTVSDNFDTDSDYVQLPPFHPRPPPPKQPTTCKLWRFVNLKSNSHHKSCGNVVEEVEKSSVKAPFPLPRKSITTLPRKINPNSQFVDCQFLKLSTNMSKSTNALNAILPDDQPPEPPPKPKKLSSSSEIKIITKPVDARFITSKPQILIQTAYATPATVAVPSQAQILFRGSQVPPSRRTQSHIVQSTLQHSQSMDNIYDTVASEDSGVGIVNPIPRKQVPLPPIPPPLLPKPSSSASSSSSVIIRPNNYIDVHASSPARNNLNQIQGSNIKPKGITNVITSSSSSTQPPLLHRGKCPPPVIPITGNTKNRSGSVPNNLHTFYIGLQNLKPLSRAPIVYPMATSCSTLNPTHQNSTNGIRGNNSICSSTLPYPPHPQSRAAMALGTNTICTTSGPTASKMTVYTSQLTRSQIQQFKAQLYSDMDYVIFPPKDPRLSQQEYYDSKSLSLTTMTSTNSNPMMSSAYSMNDIPPPYLPPPPPYPYVETGKVKKPPRPLPGTPTTSVHASPTVTSSFPQQTSYGSIYNAAMSSNTSQCSSSQYGTYYTGNESNIGSSSTLGLNAENLQKFLSTQSLFGSSYLSSPPPQIYYPASTHSAPPLPPYKNSNQVLIENGMRKAVQRQMAKNPLSPSREGIRMKLLSRSEESLYSQPVQEDTEEKLQAIYNLPPPPPYNKKPIPSDVDLTSIRQQCTAMELPLIKALLNSSDGALITKPSAFPKEPKIMMRSTSTNHTHHNPTQQKDGSKELTPPARPPKPAKLRQPPAHH